MKNYFLPVAALFLSAIGVQAQVQRTIHQTFELIGVLTVQLEIPGEYEIIPWESSAILTETKVTIYQATPSILRHFVEESKRYDFELDIQGELAHLRALDMKRDPIHIRNTPVTEVIRQKIYLPKAFVTDTASGHDRVLLRRTK